MRVPVVTEFEHLQGEVEESRQGGVGVGLSGGGANVIGSWQQQQEGDAMAELHHLLTVEAEVTGLCTDAHGHTQTHTDAHIHRRAHTHTHTELFLFYVHLWGHAETSSFDCVNMFLSPGREKYMSGSGF